MVNQKKHKMLRFVPGLDRVYEHFTEQMPDKEHWIVASALVLAWMKLTPGQRAEYLSQARSIAPGQGEKLAGQFLRRRKAVIWVDQPNPEQGKAE